MAKGADDAGIETAPIAEAVASGRSPATNAVVAVINPSSLKVIPDIVAAVIVLSIDSSPLPDTVNQPVVGTLIAPTAVVVASGKSLATNAVVDVINPSAL